MSRRKRCRMCNEEFVSHGGARTCSDECQAKVDGLRPYWVLRVICDAEQHPTKVVTIERFMLRAVRPEHAHAVEGAFESPFGLVTFGGGNQWEVDDGTFRTGPEVFGTSTKPPSGELTVRSRARLHCDLCGLTVPLTREKAQQLTVGILAAGESSVRLSALAANL